MAEHKPNTPTDREWGTTSLSQIYANDTPGEPQREAWEKNPNCQQCRQPLSAKELKNDYRVCAKCVKKNDGRVWGNDKDDVYTESTATDYRCQKCGRIFGPYGKVKAVCPRCGSTAVKPYDDNIDERATLSTEDFMPKVPSFKSFLRNEDHPAFASEPVTPDQQVSEVTPPGMEDWIKKNKAKFLKQNGAEKGLSALYATAWDIHNKQKSDADTA